MELTVKGPEPEIKDSVDCLEFNGAYASNYMIYSYIYSDPFYVFQKLIRKSALSSEQLYTMTLKIDQIAEGEGKAIHLSEYHKTYTVSHLDKKDLLRGFAEVIAELGSAGFNAIGFLPETVLTIQAEAMY